MRILVCVKFVPSAADEVRTDENHNLIRDGVAHQLNVADESAVELALRLRGDGTVTVMTMGKAGLEDGLRELLARSVDEAVLLTDRRFAGADTYATAKTLAKAVRILGDFDFILCGRRAVDGETGQVPAELAAMLGLKCVTNVTAVSCQNGDEGWLRCSRLVEDGTLELLVPLGTVVTLCEYSCVLRNAGIKGMREARKKQVQVLSADDLGISREECGLNGSLTRVVHVKSQMAGRRHVQMVKSAGELAKRLREETV